MSQTHIQSDRESPPATPGWVKGLGIVILALLLLIGVMFLSGGEHGPSRHTPPADTTQSSGAVATHSP